MRKRSEAGKPHALKSVPPPRVHVRDFDEARYAWRERYAIALDGGATFKSARRSAHAEVPDFATDAINGLFDFQVAP